MSCRTGHTFPLVQKSMQKARPGSIGQQKPPLPGTPPLSQARRLLIHIHRRGELCSPAVKNYRPTLLHNYHLLCRYYRQQTFRFEKIAFGRTQFAPTTLTVLGGSVSKERGGFVNSPSLWCIFWLLFCARRKVTPAAGKVSSV